MLAGNTEIVFQQKGLNAQAVAKGITIVPDCGLAPGMVNVLAQYGIGQLDTVSAVRMFVGGLPQQPQPPLNYQIVYSLEGVLDYYTTLSWVLRDSKRQQVRALSERETVDFGGAVGPLEAFHTAGGLSTMPFRYEGKIPSMEYKTLRYPGHAHIMEAIRDLGLLSLDPIDVKGAKVVPRDVVVAAIGPKLKKPEGRDLVALRVIVAGTKNGAPRTLCRRSLPRATCFAVSWHSRGSSKPAPQTRKGSTMTFARRCSSFCSRAFLIYSTVGSPAWGDMKARSGVSSIRWPM